MFKEVQRSAEAASNDAQRHTAGESLNILRLPAVIRRVGLSRSSIYSYQRSGSFPRGIKIGPHAVGYVAQEIDEWINRALNHREGADA